MLTAATKLEAMARLGRALADTTRCRLLLAMLDGPAYPAQLAEALALSRANVSNHLTCLRGCGLVVATPEGRHVRYELVSPALAHALGDLLDVVRANDDALPCLHGAELAEAGVGRPARSRAETVVREARTFAPRLR